MSNPITSPVPANPTGPRIYALPQVSPDEADDAESAPVSSPVDPTLAILASLGTPGVALYHVVAAHAGDDGCCTVGYAELATACGFTERHVIRLIKALEREGHIALHRRTTPTGKTLPNALEPLPGRGDMRGDMRGDIQDTPRGDMRGDISPHTPRSVNTSPEEEDLNPPNPPQPQKPAKPKPEPYTEGFERFWAAYPRRDDRKGALKVWSRLKPDAALLAVMLRAIQAQGLAQRERRFVPMPTTWLNGERWTDETRTDVESAPPPGQGLSGDAEIDQLLARRHWLLTRSGVDSIEYRYDSGRAKARAEAQAIEADLTARGVTSW